MTFGPPFFRPGRGGEHPSGLRDAILEGFAHAAFLPPNDVVDSIESVLIAALSVVSEGEIEAAARKFCDASTEHAPWESAPESVRQACREIVAEMLAASREVLIPAIESDASVIVGPSKEETR